MLPLAMTVPFECCGCWEYVGASTDAVAANGGDLGLSWAIYCKNIGQISKAMQVYVLERHSLGRADHRVLRLEADGGGSGYCSRAR